ncbi:MAG: type II toxin-antitoxin system HicB family antitoxin [Reyranellaceae bacterium]
MSKDNEGGTLEAPLMRCYVIDLLPDDEGDGFTVLCPSLPGLVTQGDTIDECLEHAQDAILGHLAALRDLRWPIPPSDEAAPGKTLISVRLV